ncbi:MAG: GAF domain-containing protein [Anaerolineae bacterium]|nr:GAF domain-containing protein [Anaerolineae bacterium]
MKRSPHKRADRMLAVRDSAPSPSPDRETHRVAPSRAERAGRALLTAIPDLVFRLDRAGVFLDYKGSTADLYVPPEQFLGRPIIEVIPQIGEQTLAYIERAFATNSVQTMRYQLPIGGDLRDYEARVCPDEQDTVFVIVRDVTDLLRTRRALSESQRRLEMALHTGGYAFWEWDVPTGQTLRDPQWAQMLGYKPEDVVPHTSAWEALLHPDDAQGAIAAFDALVSGQTPYVEYEYRLRAASGNYLWVYDYGVATERDAAGRALRVIGMHRDVTERRHAQEIEREQAALVDALRDTSAAISSTLDLNEVLDRTLANIARVVPHDVSCIVLLQGEVASVTRSQGYAEHGLDHVLDIMRVRVDEVPNLRRMRETGQPVLIGDIRQSPDWVKPVDVHVMRSYLGVPILWEGETLGFIHLQSTTPDFFTPAHAQRLQTFAGQVAFALHNAQVYDTIQRQVTELETLRQATLELTAQLDLDVVLLELVRGAMRLLNVDGGGLYLYRPDRDVIERVVNVGSAQVPAGTLLKRGEGLSGQVWAQNAPVVAADYLEWPGHAVHLEPHVTGSISVLGVPICWGDQFLGVLNARADRPDREFSDREVQLATLLASQAAIAIHNARLYETVQRHIAELEALHRVSLNITAQLDLTRLLEALVVNALQILGVESGGIYLYRPEQDDLEWVVAVGPNVAPVGSRLKRGEGLAGRVMERGTTMIHNDYSHWEGRASVYSNFEWQCVIGVPISWQGQLLGVFNAIGDARKQVFTQHDAQLLDRFASQAAIAVKNARLFAAEREQRALSEALRNTAAAINSTLDLDRVLDHILTAIAEVIPYDAANIMLAEGNSVRIADARGYDAHGSEEWTRAYGFGLERPVLTYQLLRSGQAYLVDDTATDERWLPIPETAWIRSHMAAPIHIEGETIGALNLDSARPAAFTAEQLQTLMAFADQAALAIRNARLYAEVRRYTEELEQRVSERTADLSVRNAVAETLSSSLDVDEMLNGVLHTAVQRLGVLGGGIYLLADDQSSLVMAAHYGVPVETLDLVTGIPQKGSEALPAAPLPASELAELTDRLGISSVLNVPIWRQEQVQGVIALVNNELHPWTNEEVRMLDAIGRQIGVALANARLYTEAVRDEARVRTILQSVADGLLVFDPDDHLMLMNPAAAALFAFYPQEWGGPAQGATMLWDWLRARQVAPGNVEFELPVGLSGEALTRLVAEQCAVEGCLAKMGDSQVKPCWLWVSGEGRLRDCPLDNHARRRAVQAQSAEVRDAEGQVQGTVIVLHDVTYFRELDELKDRFVSTVSHELRTPLSTVLLQVSTLLKYYDRLSEEERRKMMAGVQQQAYVLRELVEDILELSRFDARRATLQRQWFDLSIQCRSVIESLALITRERGITVQMEGCDSPCYIQGDVGQLSRAIRNLATNAVKYTPSGGRVALRLERAEGGIRLAVSDTGIGIAPEEQKHIFDRFYRTDQAMEMAGGTGLGLSITKEIVDLHGGRIELHSVPGQGSTFTVWLPESLSRQGGEGGM